MEKDWTGNKKTTFVTLGASSHSTHDREENDYYATDPIAIDALIPFLNKDDLIVEPSCGEGHLSKRLEEHGFDVDSYDLIDRGYGVQREFLGNDPIQNYNKIAIVTNPPYKYASEFVYKSMDWVEDGGTVAMFLKITFLESVKRMKLFKEHPPKHIAVFSRRVKCAIGGDFKNTGGSAVCYAWFIWEKGYTGKPQISWV